ncbi:MAG: CNP1-like family protein [Betaproteobacteria bacterium]|nr:MAG: CNP1-like family protein [Betaproteobacteria bacterium]
MAALAAACGNTGPPVDHDVEKREQFKGEKEVERELVDANVVLPSYPIEDNLIQVQFSGPKSFTYFVDTQSIFVYEGEVVRYTLVARSASGSENVSYEGIYCKARTYKSYAFGAVEQTWAVARNPNFTPIRDLDRNNIRFAMYRDYACPYGKAQRDAERVLAALKGGMPLPCVSHDHGEHRHICR